MAYYCKASIKCLFCKKKCEVLISNFKDVHPEINDSNDEQRICQSASTPLTQESILPKDVDASHDQGVNPNCSCHSVPVRFLGSSLEKWEDEKAFRDNLKYAFVLRELLDYPKRKCMKYMKQFHQLHSPTEIIDEEQNKDRQSDGWFSVCENCTKLVEEGHQIYHEIETLSIKLDELKNNLKNLLKTKTCNEKQADNDKDGDDDGVQNVSNDVLEEEKRTIFEDVHDYFTPRKVPSSSPEEGGTIVKQEIEASSSFSEDEPLIDELLTNDNFEDGSDWAPSEADEMDVDNEAEELLDIKPNIENIHSDDEKTNNKEKSEDVEKEAAPVELSHPVSEIPLPKSRKRDLSISKPAPKSVKILRATRSSGRLKREITYREASGEDNEEIPSTDRVETNRDLETDEGNASREERVIPNKKRKSILSASESESMTESDNSEDSEDDDSKGKFICGICGAAYCTRQKFIRHERLHSRDDASNCTQCSFVAASDRGLKLHMTKVHYKSSRKSFENRSASEKPSSLSKKKAKKVKPQKVGEFACTFCPVTYQTAHRLKEHQEHHLNLRSDMIKCEQCNYICLYERGMKIHVTKYHTRTRNASNADRKSGDDDMENNDCSEKEDEEEKAVYTCQICSTVYRTLHRLREHEELHRSEDAAACSLCPNVYKTKKTLRAHMHAQHGIKFPSKKYSKQRKLRPRVYSGVPQHCLLCPAKYYTNHRFLQHVKLHSSDANYPCDECGWVFSASDKRDYHMKMSHNRDDIKIVKNTTKTYQCSHCDTDPFDARYKFREHLLENHKDKVFQCGSCDRIYESQQLYDLHTETCLKKEENDDDIEEDEDDEPQQAKLFSCTECKAKFSKQEVLNKHFSLKHSAEQFPCTLCSKVFPTESRLRYHLARQHDKIQNVCKVCGYKAHGASHLRLHMQKHTKERLFACELCGRTFVSPTYLTAHKQMEHFQELGLQPIKCDKCDMQFPNNSILKYHIQKVHEKKFKYFCETCGKGFLFASGLKNHSAVHSSERTETCQICGASYVHNRVLMEHLKKHHPEEYAAVKGIDPSAVKKSAVTGNQGPFMCKFCNLECPSKWALHNHLKSHTEVYDKYKCSICGKGYSSPAGVKRHEETAHVSVTHSCQFCGKTFPCKDYLRYHVKNHCHKKEGDPSVKYEPAPSTSKHHKNQETDIKQDPHIVKEAGQLHIVTPSSNVLHHSHGQSQNPQAFTRSQIHPGSEASSSSSSYMGGPTIPQNPHQQHHDSLTDDSAVNSFYRSYFSQHGFSNK